MLLMDVTIIIIIIKQNININNNMCMNKNLKLIKRFDLSSFRNHFA